MSRKRLIVIDGYSLLFRAFYGTRFLSTSDGTPTNALFGFTGMLFNLLETTPPDAVVVALDAPGKTFRHTEYAEYKGKRRETPPELESQLEMAREFLGEMGIPIVEVVGYEADDVVGTIARRAEASGYETTIVSGDLDQVQLVDDSVSVLTTRVGVSDTVTYTPEAVRERFGVPPSAIPDWKAIVGDNSDNIPGVPGIGEKGATVLLQQFGSIEEILRRLDEVEPKYRKKIEPVAEQMPKSKWLATIDCNVPLEYDFAPFSLTAEQYERARAMLERLEFRNHLKRAPTVLGRYVSGGEAAAADASGAAASVSEPPLETSETSVGSLAELRSFVGDAEYAILPEAARSQPSMFDSGTGEGTAWIAVEGRAARVPLAMAVELFAADPGKAIVHDAKPLFKRIPPTLTPVAFDTYLAGYVLQAGRSNYSLRDLIQGYLEIEPPEKPSGQAEALRRLRDTMQARIEKEGQQRVLFEVELPLTPVLAEMECLGIRTSAEFLQDFSKSLEREIEQAAARVHELAGEKFNIGSPKQLGEILFEKLGIPGPKKTKTGYATGAEVLQQIAPSYPIAAEVLTWRELTKLKSTYADALPKMIGPDGRIHTSFNQGGAATGRLSSNDPNLQNIPIRTELGREIRKAFVAP
ncbi:MAG: DNA polymerase, partial [Fimbriimonadaceae bacterium]